MGNSVKPCPLQRKAKGFGLTGVADMLPSTSNLWLRVTLAIPIAITFFVSTDKNKEMSLLQWVSFSFFNIDPILNIIERVKASKNEGKLKMKE